MKQTIILALLFLQVNVFANDYASYDDEIKKYKYNIESSTPTLQEPIYWDKNKQDIIDENDLYVLKRIAIDQRKYIEALENSRKLLWEIIEKKKKENGYE